MNVAITKTIELDIDEVAAVMENAKKMLAEILAADYLRLSNIEKP